MCFGGAGRQATAVRSGAGIQRKVGSVSTKVTGDPAGPREYFKNPETKQMDPGYVRTGRAVSGRALMLQTQKQKVQQMQGKTGYLAIPDRPGYESGYDEQGRLFQQKKSTQKVVTTADNLGRTAVADEASLRIKTKASRQAAAEDKGPTQVPRKNKRRGGLRLDRSAGTNSVSSGVFIPK